MKPLRPLLALLALLAAPTATATWYGDGSAANGSDIMMMDIRYPYWAGGFYNAFWNFSIAGGTVGFTGYGGLVHTLNPDPAVGKPDPDSPLQETHQPRSVWSFWGKSETGEPVRIVECSPFTFPAQYIGEGASGAAEGRGWDFIKPRRWYTQLVRTWQPLPEEGKEIDHCFMGRWIKDVENNRWHLYGVARIPTAGTHFGGTSGFMESVGGWLGAIERRFGYCRKDGGWLSNNVMSFKVGATGANWVVAKRENDTVLAFEIARLREQLPFTVPGEPLAFNETHRFETKQPPAPTLDLPVLASAEAIHAAGAVLVRWDLADSSSPQFAYRIELFNGSTDTAPLATVEARDCVTHQVLVPTDAADPVVRLTLLDVFDQSTEPQTLQATASGQPKPALFPVPEGIISGLSYEWSVGPKREAGQELPAPLALLGESDPRRAGQIGNIDLRPISEGQKKHFGTRLRGFLDVPETGIYIFHTRTNDGFHFTLSGQELFHNDTVRGPARRIASIHLEKGLHPLEIDTFLVTGLSTQFEIEWERPGHARSAIPAEALRHLSDGPLPEALIAVSGEGTLDPEISVTVNPAGRQIESIRLYLDDLEVARSEGASLTSNQLLPAGRHRIHARVFFDKIQTMDTEAQEIEVAAGELDGWRIEGLAETGKPHNFRQIGDDRIEFVGQGSFFLHQPAEGDYMLTARLESLTDGRKSIISPKTFVGIGTSWEPNKPTTRPVYMQLSLFSTAHGVLHSTADYSDLNASGTSHQTFPNGHRWLRIVRSGQHASYWTSADGKDWQFGSARFGIAAAKHRAGVFFSALPQHSLTHFRAVLSDISIEPLTGDGRFDVPAPVMPETGPVDLVGVVVALGDPQVVALRSRTRGVLLSTDGGTTWNEANGQLNGPANAVRSVAIDPTDPRNLWRAADAGLFRSSDGGRSWQPVDFPGDFDGSGPSSLCGEIIAIHPRDPAIMVVGSESQGLFRSADGGATWQRVAPADRRFTTVVFHRDRHTLNNSVPVSCLAMTSADRWIPFLGQGDARLATEATDSFCYESKDDGQRFGQTAASRQWGYFNATYTYGHPGLPLLGTSHGLMRGTTGGFLYSTANVQPDRLRPITAIGCGAPPSTFTLFSAIDPEQPASLVACIRTQEMSLVRQTIAATDSKPVLKITSADPVADSPSKRSGGRWWILKPDGLHLLEVPSGELQTHFP